jgi:hypothetical protein
MSRVSRPVAGDQNCRRRSVTVGGDDVVTTPEKWAPARSTGSGRIALVGGPSLRHGGGVRRWVFVRSPLAKAVTAPAVLVLVLVLVLAYRWLGPASGWFAFVVVWWPMVWVGTMSRLVQLRLPEGVHVLRPFERDGRVYERIGVPVAKRLLRRGPLARFNPQLHLPTERTPEQLARLAQRMRDAEASHAVLFVATSAVAAHAALRGWWSAALLTLVLDVVMNGYPVMLQRYNRARLARRYELAWV